MAKITVTIEAANWNEARQIMCDATGGHIGADYAKPGADHSPALDRKTSFPPEMAAPYGEPEKTEVPKPEPATSPAQPVADSAEKAATGGLNPAPTATPAASGPVETDKNGLPWDARIHSGSKNKIADGSWRKKKGVEPEVVEQVEQELRALMALPAAEPTPSVFAENDASAAFGGAPEAPKPETAAIAAQPAAVPPATTTAPPAATADPSDSAPNAVAPDIRTIADLMGLVLSKKLSNDSVMSVLQKHGIQALPLLGARPDLIPAVAADLRAL